MEQEKVSIIRYRGSKLSKVKELDLFPKIEETYKETSPIGGTCNKLYETVIIIISLF